jgi:RNA polymerase sigma-70 factor (ECF subfamily)
LTVSGYISLYNGTLQTTSFEIEGAASRAIYKSRNPGKLAHIFAISHVGH